MRELTMCSGKGQYASGGSKGLETVTWSQIINFSANPESVEKKDARWVIPSTLLSRKFKEQENGGCYFLLWADLDKDVPSIERVSNLVGSIVGSTEYLVYLTRSATEINQKCRILIPLSRGLKPRQWQHCQIVLNNYLDSNGLVSDRASERFGQLCYLPNKGEYYQYVHIPGLKSALFEPLLSFGNNIQSLIDEEHETERVALERAENARCKREEWLGKGVGSVIDWYNQHYSVEEILIDNGYDQKGGSFRHPASESGSYSATVDPITGRVHALSSSDQLYTGGGGVGAHDAYSAFTILEHEGDDKDALTMAKKLKDDHEKRTLRDLFEQLGIEQAKKEPCDQLVADINQRIHALESQGNRGGFKLIYANDLLSAPKPLEWLIKDYLPPVGLGFINGESASGKSFLSIDWCCAIVTGKSWRDKKVSQGGAVILAGEGQFGIKRRLKAWEIDNGIDLSTCPIAVSDIGAALVDDNSLTEVECAIDDFVDKLGPLKILVVDTLHRNLGSGDENSAHDMAVYFRNLDYLRMRYNCLIMTVHHTGHGEKGRARGSSSIKAGVDIEFLVKQKNDVSTVECTKMKDGPKANKFGFKIESVALPWVDVDGHDESSAVIKESVLTKVGSDVEMNPATELVFTELVKLFYNGCSSAKEVVTELEWRNASYSVMTQDNLAAKAKAYGRAKDKLQSIGLITVLNNTYSINLNKLTEKAKAIVGDYALEEWVEWGE